VYPEKLDILQFCTPKLKAALTASRTILQEEEEKKTWSHILEEKREGPFPEGNEER